MTSALAPHSLFKICRPIAAKKITSFPPPNPLTRVSVLFDHRGNASLAKRFCTKKKSADEVFEGFSVLSSDIPWDDKDIWSTFGAYFFCLHIPFSYGGLSVISYILHEPVLDPLMMAVSITMLQATEFVGALALVHYISKSQYKLSSFFLGKLFAQQRSWTKASAVGIGILIGLVLVTSIVADRLIGPKDVNNPILREILMHNQNAKTTCVFLYCLVTPLLEETVYRGFLLTSLASRMKWWQAVVISSCVFSIAHFSGENSLQLFLIGCVLGSVYCWTGNLAASFSVHSVYNAIILLVTIIS